MPKRGRKIVWTQGMLKTLERGVRKGDTFDAIAVELGVSRTTVHNKVQALRGKPTTKSEKIRVNQPANNTLTGNVTLVHKNFTMTSKGNNVTITINQ